MATSSKTISIKLPASWGELTKSQLYYVYSLIADNLSLTQIKSYMFFKWARVLILAREGEGYWVRRGSVKGYLPVAVVSSAIASLNWVEQFPATPVRIDEIDEHKAVDACLIGLPFGSFLSADNYYQGYLHTQNDAILDELAKILYQTDRIRLNKCERISIFYWFTSAKAYLSRKFSHFFQPLTASPENLLESADIGKRISDAMNAQIRALTKGDITKEKEVLEMDVWRALTELDAQAREYEEIKRKTNGKI